MGWRALIYGTRGAIHYTLFGDVVRGATVGDDGLREIEVPDADVRLQTTDAEFVRAILHGGPVEPDFEEGVRYMGVYGGGRYFGAYGGGCGAAAGAYDGGPGACLRSYILTRSMKL